ncbi:MAG TPA: Arc family DNA-binding protein [Mycobacterium sp.]|jgi:plasmid stability protein|nr:Arc family DNA-binding protein [Mycobacterium sp.]HEX4586875.1 Arc family DNA-binding protein [Mycobacterium sp.]
MATLTVRDLDDDLKAALRVRAAKHGRSMESEVREILRTALERPSSGPGMATRIRQRFADVAGVADLEPPNRTERPRAAKFGG